MLEPSPAPTLAAVVEAVRAALADRCAVPPEASVVAACSGGADSVALVHALAGAHAGPLTVAFVDHGLRPCAADREAAEVAARAVDRPFVALSLGLAPGPNLQARARAARYEALLAVAGAGLVATGHTRTDRAETLLLRLLRGAGPRGLAGLGWRRGRLVRPLLGISREVTRGLGLGFVDDPSNATSAFQRNRVRLSLLPALAREQPDIEATLVALAEMLVGQRALLDRLVAAVDPATIDLRGASQAEAEAFAHALVSASDVGVVPRRGALEGWAAALTRGEARGTYPLGQDLVGLARAGRAALRRVADPRARVVAWGPGTYRHAHVTLEISPMPLSPASNAPADRPDESGTGALELVAARAVGAIDWPVTLRRSRREGSQAIGSLAARGLEIDLATGRRLGGYEVVDGAGRSLLPAPEAVESLLDTERASERGAYQLRIFARRDEEVVAEHNPKLISRE